MLWMCKPKENRNQDKNMHIFLCIYIYIYLQLLFLARVWDLFFFFPQNCRKTGERSWEVRDVQGLFELFVAVYLIFLHKIHVLMLPS